MQEQVVVTEANGRAALEAAERLARTLTRSAEYAAFERAQEAVHEDARAREMLRAFQELQWEQQANWWDGLGEERRKRLQGMWEEMNQYPVTADYLRAQDGLVDLFREVNSLLTEGLGFDYASLCAPGCCG